MQLQLGERHVLHSGAKFAFVGILNSFIGLISIYCAKGALGLGDTAANAFGYAIGLAVSFGLNKTWTFRYDGAAGPALLRFVGVFLLAYFANLVTVLGAIAFFRLNTYIAQAIGVLPYAVLFYLGSRYLAFR